MSELAIKIEDLSKLYQLGSIGTGTLKNDMRRWWARMKGEEDPFSKVGVKNDRTRKTETDFVWALRDISFEVGKGEVLGIIGRNGAGKSTLLKILSKITSPTTGSIQINGRIASLLEVGTGFHPELTGRENIYLNGAILGMRKKEVSSKFDEIVDFSGIEAYIDTPVKRYSSGMYVRLAFAVAAFLEPEILVLDEVLAVGDAEFQKKCLGRMKEVSTNEGRTVLFVSHNLGAVRNLTNRCVLIEQGQLTASGEPSAVIERYLHSGMERTGKLINGTRLNEFWGTIVRLDSLDPVYSDGLEYFRFCEDLVFEIGFSSRQFVREDLRFGCTISTLEDKPVASMMTDHVIRNVGEGQYVYRFKVKSLHLFPAAYKISLSIGKGNFQEARKEYDVLKDAAIFHIENISETEASVFNWQPAYGELLHPQCEAEKL